MTVQPRVFNQYLGTIDNIEIDSVSMGSFIPDYGDDGTYVNQVRFFKQNPGGYFGKWNGKKWICGLNEKDSF